jgi:hypothetical protein
MGPRVQPFNRKTVWYGEDNGYRKRVEKCSLVHRDRG